MPWRPASSAPSAALLLMLCAFSAAAQAQEESLAPSDLAPSESLFWKLSAAALVGALVLDTSVRSTFEPDGEGSLNGLSEAVNPLGRPQRVLAVLGAAYLAGKIAGAPRLSSSAWHIATVALAAGAVNTGVKFTVGRRRPDERNDPAHFAPLNEEDRWQAFPSGHVAIAFSLAAAISEETEASWVPIVSYGTASMVGWSRIYEDRHWSSDVVGGAILGIAVSRATLRLLHGGDAHEPAVPGELTLLPNGISLRIPTR
jgi:membrane-associated phospholipid phosphatase